MGTYDSTRETELVTVVKYVHIKAKDSYLPKSINKA